MVASDLKIPLRYLFECFFSSKPIQGLLTYVSCLSDNPSVGLGIACAIGLHNIPEGFAVAFPIKIGTKGNRRKALFFAAITGFAEPVGAFIGWMIFGVAEGNSASDYLMFGILFGITAGIMTEVAIKRKRDCKY